MSRKIIQVSKAEALDVLRRRRETWPGFRPATPAEADPMREQLARDFGQIERIELEAEARVPLAERFPDHREMFAELGIADATTDDERSRLDLSGIDPNSPFARAMRGAW